MQIGFKIKLSMISPCKCKFLCTIWVPGIILLHNPNECGILNLKQGPRDIILPDILGIWSKIFIKLPKYHLFK